MILALLLTAAPFAIDPERLNSEVPEEIVVLGSEIVIDANVIKVAGMKLPHELDAVDPLPETTLSGIAVELRDRHIVDP